MANIQVYRVSHNGSQGGYVNTDPQQIVSFIETELEHRELGETLLITIEEMDQDEYEGLDDFDGF